METLLEVFTLGVAVAPPKRTDAEVEAIRTKLAQHRRPAGNVKSEGAQALLSVVAASLGRTRRDLTQVKSGRLTDASFATSLTVSELRQRVHLWMDALDQLGFSGNMLYYHVHLVARKLERDTVQEGVLTDLTSVSVASAYATWAFPKAFRALALARWTTEFSVEHQGGGTLCPDMKALASSTREYLALFGAIPPTEDPPLPDRSCN